MSLLPYRLATKARAKKGAFWQLYIFREGVYISNFNFTEAFQIKGFACCSNVLYGHRHYPNKKRFKDLPVHNGSHADIINSWFSLGIPNVSNFCISYDPGIETNHCKPEQYPISGTKNEQSEIILVNFRITKAWTLPSIALIAAEASSLDVKVTKPNPLDLPVSRSVMTRAERHKNTN